MTKFMIPFVLGMIVAGGIVGWRVEACRLGSETGQCAVWIDKGGIRLAEIKWPTK